ncbi:hypothetical protein [Chryseobacterium sp. 2R14A]|uniref:hypothetical protein n=1 Tax=Chryseobacterium sp. 2R14A TaxID=3380353 RepID=UPI003CF6D30A
MKRNLQRVALVLTFLSLLNCETNDSIDYIDKNTSQSTNLKKPSPIITGNGYLLGNVFHNNQVCFSTDNTTGFGNYKYYVSTDVPAPYDRTIYSTAIKQTSLIPLPVVIIPAGEYVSDAKQIFIDGQNTSKIGDVTLKILSVKENNINVTSQYDIQTMNVYIDNCFISTPNNNTPCLDSDGNPIDNNHNNIWDCHEFNPL